MKKLLLNGSIGDQEFYMYQNEWDYSIEVTQNDKILYSYCADSYDTIRECLQFITMGG
jgi:phenolic acid decarboxylase